MKKRELYVRKHTPLQQSRLDNGECPNCGKPKSQWTGNLDWVCCCKECSDIFYQSGGEVLDWKKIRKQAFKRDNYTCVMCGKKYTYAYALTGDHINPIACGGDEFDLDNIQTLCPSCNRKKTKFDSRLIAGHRRCKELGINPDCIKCD